MRFRRGVFLLCSLTLFGQKGVDVSALDRTCKPCDDVDQFANGNWNKANPIPASQVRWSKRFQAADRTKYVLRDLLETAANQPDGDYKKIGDYYSACMDTAAIDALGVKPIKPILARIDSMKSVPETLIWLSTEQNLAVPFGVGPTQDAKEPSEVITGVGGNGLGLPDRDYYLATDAKNQATREKYGELITKLFSLAGINDPNAAKTILDFETSLAKVQLTRVERRDPYATYHRMKLDELQQITPHFDWKPYLTALKVPVNVDVNVGQPKYMAEVERLMASAPLDTWKTYLKWHVLRANASRLSKPFFDANHEFFGAYLTGIKEQDPRWKFCASAVDAAMGESLGKLYVEKAFPPEAKAKMQDMVKNLLLALKEDLESITWMTDETKKKALAKLATFDPKVGYPDKWIDYTPLQVTRKSYIDNARMATRFNRDLFLKDIGKPFNKGRWGMTTPTSNAYYHPQRNEIVFPAGILLPPMFDMQADDAINYGAIGSVIGHEISHGFDDQGSQFDAEGRLKNWWTPEDRKRFMERAGCVVDQFNSYLIEDGTTHINGKLVLGESIGDLGGVKLAYRAWKISQRGKTPAKIEDGFTADQRFFMGWAQARGDMTRLETQRLMVVTDPHPVAKYRVIGPLSNLPEFREAFGCKKGDRMVRESPCEVW